MEELQGSKRYGRDIESDNNRYVHFIFNPNQPIKMTPFTKKFLRYIDGSMVEKEQQDQEAFNSYLERLKDGQLEEGETNPIKFGINPFFELEL